LGRGGDPRPPGACCGFGRVVGIVGGHRWSPRGAEQRWGAMLGGCFGWFMGRGELSGHRCGPGEGGGVPLEERPRPRRGWGGRAGGGVGRWGTVRVFLVLAVLVGGLVWGLPGVGVRSLGWGLGGLGIWSGCGGGVGWCCGGGGSWGGVAGRSPKHPRGCACIDGGIDEKKGCSRNMFGALRREN